MATIRVNKTDDYTVMSNGHFRNPDMSLKAKGLLSLMLSLPDDWDYSIEGLCKICKENQVAIKNTLNELKELGYLVITKKMPSETESGRIEYEYNIYEEPQKQEVCFLGVENLALEKQPLEIQALENQRQLNTNIQNTKDIKEKKIKEKKKDEIGVILSEITNPELRDTYREFIKMRKLIRAPMTGRALTMLIKRVNELENGLERQKQVLETSIINNWKSVYPLKDQPKNKDQSKDEGWDDYESPCKGSIVL